MRRTGIAPLMIYPCRIGADEVPSGGDVEGIPKRTCQRERCWHTLRSRSTDVVIRICPRWQAGGAEMESQAPDRLGCAAQKQNGFPQLLRAHLLIAVHDFFSLWKGWGS